MYKLVTVDDETIIVEGMAKRFPWEKWNCQVVATVSDKDSLGELLEEYKPHLILTDIEITGIARLKKLDDFKAEITDAVKGISLDKKSSFIVKNAIKYIEEHYDEKLTLLEAAEHTYVSQWHLSKLLNQEVGYGFSEILNMVRIQHAKELLQDRSLRVSDVAEMVGFVNVSHFSRVFKKIVGVSPNGFRNEKYL